MSYTPDPIVPGWSNAPGGPVRTDPQSKGSSKTITYNDIQAWKFVAQYMMALRERWAAVYGTKEFPPPDQVFYRGTSTSAVDNGDGTITIGCGSVNWAPAEHCSSVRWVDYSCTPCGSQNIPASYDLSFVNDDTDPWTNVRGTIVAQTWTATNPDGAGTGSLKITSKGILNAITAGYIPNVSYLSGKDWTILRQGSLSVSDRLFDKPDGMSLIKGLDSTGGVTTTWAPSGVSVGSMSYSYLTDNSLTGNPPSLPPDIFTSLRYQGDPTGKELLVFDSGGILRRVSILGGKGGTYYFANQTWTGSGVYAIVEPGTICTPGRSKTIIPGFQWYSGISNFLYTHLADDTVGLWQSPAVTTQWLTGDPCSTGVDCAESTVSCFDSDPFIEFDVYCAGALAGTHPAKNVYKSLRMMQIMALSLCQSYIDPSASYVDAAAIPNFTIATFLYKLNINAWTCGYSYTDSGHITISGTPSGLTYPIGVYAALIYPDGSVEEHDGTLTSSTVLSGNSFPNNTTPTPNPTSVVLSLGFTRYRPLRVRYLEPRTEFIPDADDDDGVLDPPATTTDEDGSPDCFGVGQWIKRPKSNFYSIRGPQGIPGDDGGQFKNRDLARLAGDNPGDPTIVPQIAAGDPPIRIDLAPYYDHFQRGQYSKDNQAIIDESKKGRSFSTTTLSLTDGTKNWWSDSVNGQYTQKGRASISSIVPYTPATAGNPTATPPVAPTPIVPGSATAPIRPPSSPLDASWVVTDDLDGSGNGSEVLDGIYTFPSGATSPTTVSGLFTSVMAGMTITFTYTGTLHVESGTVSSGTSTSMTDSSHNTTTFPNKCWWGSTRFTFGAPYVNFILEVSRSVSGVSKTWKMPITNSTNGASGVTFTFAAISGFTPTSGDTWQVREPAYQLNKWEELLVKIKDPSGGTYTANITFSDDNTFWIDELTPTDDAKAGSYGDMSPITMSDGSIGLWSYEIVQIPYGSVMRYTEGEDDYGSGLPTGTWDIATGDDDHRTGVPPSPSGPQPFTDNPTFNLEGIVKDYGFAMMDDVGLGEVFTELYHAINLMQKTAGNFGWVYESNPGTPENNLGALADVESGGDDLHMFATSADKTQAAGDGDDSSAPVLSSGVLNSFYSNIMYNYVDNFGSNPSYGPEPIPPHRAFSTYIDLGLACETNYMTADATVDAQGGDASYAYPQINGVPTVLIPTIEFYVYCTVDSADHDEGHHVTEAGGAFPPNTWLDNYYTFDPGSSGAAYRSWTSIGSGTPDGTGSLTGGQFGDNLVTGTPATYTSSDGTGDTNQGYWPGSIPIPEGGPDAIGALPRTADTGYDWQCTVLNGFFVKKTQALLTWPFVYAGPYT